MANSRAARSTEQRIGEMRLPAKDSPRFPGKRERRSPQRGFGGGGERGRAAARSAGNGAAAPESLKQPNIG